MIANESTRPGVQPEAGAEQISDGGSASAIVPRGAGKPLRKRADGSLVPPSFGRKTWRAVARCVDDGSVTVHVFRDPDRVNDAVRTGACGCRYVLRVRRTLDTWEAAA